MIDNATRVRGRPTRRPSGIVRRRRRRAAPLPLFFSNAMVFRSSTRVSGKFKNASLPNATITRGAHVRVRLHARGKKKKKETRRSCRGDAFRESTNVGTMALGRQLRLSQCTQKMQVYRVHSAGRQLRFKNILRRYLFPPMTSARGDARCASFEQQSFPICIYIRSTFPLLCFPQISCRNY